GDQGSDTFNVGTSVGVGKPSLNDIKGSKGKGPLVIRGDGLIGDGIAEPLESDRDTLNVDDSGDVLENIGEMTENRITGLGMTVGIKYETINRVNVKLGTQKDEFTVTQTGAELTTINAGAGNDVITVTAIANPIIVNGNDGDDTLDASTITSTMIMGGGSGNDHIIGGSASDQLRGDSTFTVTNTTFALTDGKGAGSDGKVTFTTDATPGNDTLEGGDGQDWIFGEAGNDTIFGGRSIDQSDTTDFIFGGAGNDNITGDNAIANQGSDDFIFGDNGTLTIQDGTEFAITGDPSTGTLIFFSNAAKVTQATGQPGSNEGTDTIQGGVGNDTVFGGGA
ncbi:MAG TPA: calcium-binding protein, partial [Terriglobia bacterium]|nr:calcium-binding protein [Terriglobia bacterium]